MGDMTNLRARLDDAMRNAALAGKTDPAQELLKAIMCSFPGAPLTDLKVTTET